MSPSLRLVSSFSFPVRLVRRVSGEGGSRTSSRLPRGSTSKVTGTVGVPTCRGLTGCAFAVGTDPGPSAPCSVPSTTTYSGPRFPRGRSNPASTSPPTTQCVDVPGGDESKHSSRSGSRGRIVEYPTVTVSGGPVVTLRHLFPLVGFITGRVESSTRGDDRSSTRTLYCVITVRPRVSRN